MSAQPSGPHSEGHGSAVVVADPDLAEGPQDAMISLRNIRESARRNRWVWVGCSLLSLVLGVAIPFALPVKYKAVSDLYLVEPATENQADAMANDVSLLQTDLVGEKALTDLHLRQAPAAFSYQGIAVSNVILYIEVTSSTQVDAITYANALNSAFLQVRAQQLEQQTNVVVKALNGQVAVLNDDIQALTGSIDSLSSAPAGAQSASEIASLVNERSGEASQITQLEGDISQDQLQQATVLQGSHVLDPAVADTSSRGKAVATDGLSGLVGGLGIGLGIVILSGILSERPRRRDEVASLLWAPIELSLPHYRRSRFLSGPRLRRRLKKPNAAIQMVQRRLRVNLEISGGQALAVVEMEAAELAGLAVGNLALALASEGKSVFVVDAADDRPLGALFCPRRKYGIPRRINVGGRQVTLLVAPRDPILVADVAQPQDVDVVLVLASADPSFGAEHIARWADRAVVILTGGKVTATRIAAAGQLLRSAGVSLQSAILLGARPEDESIGATEYDPSAGASTRSLGAQFDGSAIHKGSDSPAEVPAKIPSVPEEPSARSTPVEVVGKLLGGARREGG